MFYKVLPPSVNYEFKCPNLVELNQQFLCNFTIYQYNLGCQIDVIYINFGDGSVITQLGLDSYSSFFNFIV